MKLLYTVTLNSGSVGSIILPVTVFVEEIGGTPDPDYFTREVSVSE